MKVLLVEDNEQLRYLLSRELRRDNYVVEPAATYAQAVTHLNTAQFELLLIDWLLPDGSGLEVVAAYRANGGGGAAILITARTSVADMVTALEAGADDVLAKPFAIAELRARIRAVLRRPRQWLRQVYSVGNLVLDCEQQSASLGQQALNLTPKEWLLLRCLARLPGRLVPRAELVSQVWDDNHEPDQHSLDVHMSNLRAKLAAAGKGVAIVTRRGAGCHLVSSSRPDR